MASRLIGEAGETPPPSSSVAAEWFAELGSEVQALLADGSVDNIELQATVLLIPDQRISHEEFTERAATWEEAQNPDLEGNWEVVHSPGAPITAYSIYAHRKDSGANHIEDFPTHEEAVTKGNALAALLGVELHDLSPETP